MEGTTAGAAFAEAVAAKDYERLRGLFATDLDFRGLTPSRNWESVGPDTLLTEILPTWFEEEDIIERLEHVETDSFADRERVGYRFSVTNPDGRFLVEQQAYIGTDADGLIAWMRVVCSGFRPVNGES